MIRKVRFFVGKPQFTSLDHELLDDTVELAALVSNGKEDTWTVEISISNPRDDLPHTLLQRAYRPTA